MGEAHGWRSREALDAALLLKRLELPNESSWFVGKMAEAVLNLYAELDEHPNEPEHPKVRGAVRRLRRLEELDRLDPENLEASTEDSVPSEEWEDPARETGSSQEPLGASENVADEPEIAAQPVPVPEALRRIRTNSGGRDGSLGGSVGRPVLPLSKSPPHIPNAGQHVDLRLEAGSCRRGFGAISEP
jgi:hypothetical protein